MIVSIAAESIVEMLPHSDQQSWSQNSGLATLLLGTLVVNLLGSFVLGFVLRLAAGATVITPKQRIGLTIGFCWALSTMGRFSYECMRSLTEGHYNWAAPYIAGTIAGCVAAVVLGTVLARRLV